MRHLDHIDPQIQGNKREAFDRTLIEQFFLLHLLIYGRELIFGKVLSKLQQALHEVHYVLTTGILVQLEFDQLLAHIVVLRGVLLGDLLVSLDSVQLSMEPDAFHLYLLLLRASGRQW